MTELVTSGSVGGMASNGCLYPENLLRSSNVLNLMHFFIILSSPVE